MLEENNQILKEMQNDEWFQQKKFKQKIARECENLVFKPSSEAEHYEPGNNEDLAFISKPHLMVSQDQSKTV